MRWLRRAESSIAAFVRKKRNVSASLLVDQASMLIGLSAYCCKGWSTSF